MRRYVKLLVASLFLAFMSSNVSALVITPSDCNQGINCWIESSFTGKATPTYVENLTGFADLEELYKWNVGDSSAEKEYADSYVTEFFNTASDPEDATITWVLGEDFFTCPSCLLEVKDGNNDPARYFYDLSAFGWDGMETLFLTDFWPQQGAISHVSIWANESLPTQEVSEPSFIAFFSLFAAGLVFARKQHQI